MEWLYTLPPASFPYTVPLGVAVATGLAWQLSAAMAGSLLSGWKKLYVCSLHGPEHTTMLGRRTMAKGRAWCRCSWAPSDSRTTSPRAGAVLASIPLRLPGCCLLAPLVGMGMGLKLAMAMARLPPAPPRGLKGGAAKWLQGLQSMESGLWRENKSLGKAWQCSLWEAVTRL